MTTSTTSPRWGLVTAAPHQHLIHIRKGRILRSAQGASCFKLPGDAVALVDTSVHRLGFSADQVTREKTGVQVSGLAVYRIVAPELAWRMLDLGDPTSLEQILAEMFAGATRRLVANLTLEDCMTRRKEALASELMAEIAPVLAGAGQDADHTDRGWGVALDTIEIQDVRILSEEVFERLQAPYREALRLDALRAEEEVLKEQARIDAEAAARSEEHAQALQKIEEARLTHERERAERAAAHEQALLDQVAAAEGAREARRTEGSLARLQREAEAALARAELEVEAHRQQRESEIALEARARAVVSDEVRAQELWLSDTLPQLAEAFAGTVDHAVVTQGDWGFLVAGVRQVLGMAEELGLRLPTATDD